MTPVYTYLDLIGTAATAVAVMLLLDGGIAAFRARRKKREEKQRVEPLPPPAIGRVIRVRPHVRFAVATADVVWRAPWDCRVTRISYLAAHAETLSLTNTARVLAQGEVVIEAVHPAFLAGMKTDAFLSKGGRLEIQTPPRDGAWIISGVRRGEVVS